MFSLRALLFARSALPFTSTCARPVKSKVSHFTLASAPFLDKIYCNTDMLKRRNRGCSNAFPKLRNAFHTMTNQYPSLLLVTTSYPLRKGSVSGVFVERLSTALSRLCDLVVLTPADNGVVVEQQSETKIRTFRYAPTSMQTLAHGHGGIPAALAQNPMKTLLVLPFLAAMLIACLVRARHHDALIANWSVTGVISGLVGKLTGRPVITVLRGEDANRASIPGTHRNLLRACLQLSHKVVAVSEAIAERIISEFPEHAERVILIPNGVDDAFLNVAPPSDEPPPSRLLFVGSLIPRKSVDTLIDAMAQLPPRFTLSIAGDGPEGDRLRAACAALSLDDRVHFLGQQPHDALPSLLATHEFLVLPSLGEGRANVILEAFAAARPVIASDIDGNRELIGRDERGRLFPARDAQALAERVLSLSGGETYTDAATRAREFIIANQLSWDHCARRYLDLINEVSTS